MEHFLPVPTVLLFYRQPEFSTVCPVVVSLPDPGERLFLHFTIMHKCVFKVSIGVNEKWESVKHEI